MAKWKTIDYAVVTRVEEGGIYKLKEYLDSALIASTIIPCELWHRILAHVNYKSLKTLSKVVTGLPEIQIDHEGVFKQCTQGNNTKNPFPRSNSKAKGILDIVHSYAFGSMLATSLRGRVYYIYFINDYSHKTWIYFMKGKYGVFERFK